MRDGYYGWNYAWAGGALNRAGSWYTTYIEDGVTKRAYAGTAPDETYLVDLSTGGTISGALGIGWIRAVGNYKLQGLMRVDIAEFTGDLSMNPLSSISAERLSHGMGNISGRNVNIDVVGDFNVGRGGATIGNIERARIASDAFFVFETASMTLASSELNVSYCAVDGKLKAASGTRLNTSGGLYVTGNESTSSIVELDASTLNISSDEFLSVGDYGPSQLSIKNGSVVSTGYLVVAAGEGAISSVTVDRANTRVSLTGTRTDISETTVGYLGQGSIAVSNNAVFEGGLVTCLGVTNRSTGRIRVSSGGSFSTEHLVLGGGYISGGVGSILVTGVNSKMVVGSTVTQYNGSISVSGNGTFTVGSDAKTISNTISIGRSGSFAANGSQTIYCALNVDGTLSNKSTLTLAGPLSGDGTLLIHAGAKLTLKDFATPTTAPTIKFNDATGALALKGEYTDQRINIAGYGQGASVSFSKGGLTSCNIVDAKGVATKEVRLFSGSTKIANIFFDSAKTAGLVTASSRGATTALTSDLERYQLKFEFSQSLGPNGRIALSTLKANIYDADTGILLNATPFQSGASCDDAFPLMSASHALDKAPTKLSPGKKGLVYNINSFASKNQNNVEIHVGSPETRIGGQYSYDSESCIVVSKSRFLDPLKGFLANLAKNDGVNISDDNSISKWINNNIDCSMEVRTQLPQATLGISRGAADNTFKFDISRSIEKKIKVLYSVTDENTRKMTTREVFINPNQKSSIQISIASLFKAGTQAFDTSLSNPTMGQARYKATFGAELAGSKLSDHFTVKIEHYQILHAASDWYFDSRNTAINPTDVRREALMFGPAESRTLSFNTPEQSAASLRMMTSQGNQDATLTHALFDAAIGNGNVSDFRQPSAAAGLGFATSDALLVAQHAQATQTHGAADLA